MSGEMIDTYMLEEIIPETAAQADRMEELIEKANSAGKGELAAHLHGCLGPLRHCGNLMMCMHHLDQRLQVVEQEHGIQVAPMEWDK